VGWKTQAFEQDPSYQMFAASTGPLGGTVAHADGPPHWLPFLGSTDIEATVQHAVSLGATVVTDITSIPNGGRWARLTDPQGAAFAVYQSATKPAREKPPKRGEFSWHELMTSDYKAAFRFYSAVFNWEKTSEMDMGEGLGVYFMFGRNGIPLGGMFNTMPQMQGGPAWTGYIRVKDVNKAVKKAKAGGATLINGPMEVPGGDWIAQFIDPQGAMFAVHALKADLAPPAEPATAAPEQGTLDFPPVGTTTPEKVAVAGKKPAAQAAGKTAPSKPKVSKTPAKKAAAKQPVARKVAAKKASAKKAPAKKAPARKAAAKKRTAGKKAAKTRAAAPKRAKKVARKMPGKQAKKKARRAK
jgi:predicted enzyme related to lactoylglutathione lyase